MNLKNIFGLRRIIDIVDSEKDYVLKCVGNARQVRENLMKILFIDDERNYKHWKQELATHFINMVDTKISGDSKSNSMREKVLTNLLIESPYGKGEDFVYNSLAVANCAFADEDIEQYDSKKLEEELDNRFFRSHQSAIVNLDNVERIDFENNVIIFNNDFTCSLLSRSAKKILKKMIFKQIDNNIKVVKYSKIL